MAREGVSLDNRSKWFDLISRWAAAGLRAGVVLVITHMLLSVFWYVALTALVPRGRIASPQGVATVLSLVVAVPLALVQFWLSYHGQEAAPDRATASDGAPLRTLRDEWILAPPVIIGVLTFIALLVIAWLGISAQDRSAFLVIVGVGGTFASAGLSAWCGWMAAGNMLHRVIMTFGGAAVGFLGHILFFVIACAVLATFGVQLIPNR
jgi:hypothetical protein